MTDKISPPKFFPKIYENFDVGSNANCPINANGTITTIDDIVKTACTANTTTIENTAMNLVQYQSIFDTHKVIAYDLVRTLNGFIDGVTNSALIDNINNMMTPLKEEKNKLSTERKHLEEEARIHDTVFQDESEKADIPSPSLMTIQDWVIAALMVSYLFAGLGLIGYIGYTTGWNKKTLLMTTLALIVISVLFYILLQSYA
jgi:hypothetical protein